MRFLRLTSILILVFAGPARATIDATGEPVRSELGLGEHDLAGGAILWAFAGPDDAAYRAAISAAAGGIGVDYFDARTGAPGSELLDGYPCVYTSPLNPYGASTTTGDQLADYVDQGGTVVLGLWARTGGLLGAAGALSGRILTSDYAPVSGASSIAAVTTYKEDGETYLHRNVAAYDCYSDTLSLQGDGIYDGTYANGAIAQAFRPDGRVVYSNGAGYQTLTELGCSGDWPQLVANACLGGPKTLTVTKLSDGADGTCDADCSLREAVIEANANDPFEDTILLGPGTHTLSIVGQGEDAAATGDLDITDDVVIQGLGTGLRGDAATTIDAQGIDRVFHVDPVDIDPELLFVDSVTIRDLSITGGIASNYGGGLWVRAPTTLERVHLTGNEAGISGGGLLSGLGNGIVTMIDCTVSGNTARYGAGMQIEDPGATLLRSTVSGNTTIDPPRSADGRSEIESGPGVRLAAGPGAGVRVASDGSVVITNSTLSGNRSETGAGDAASNSSSVVPGIAFRSSTVARNAGSGVTIEGPGISAANTIVDGSCSQPLTSLGGNLEAPGTTCGFANDRDLSVPYMRLSALEDNGGLTQTHGLAAGSPAIDAGLLAHCEGTDQRGVARPLDGNGAPPSECDAGAVELDPLTDDFTTIFPDGFESGTTDAWTTAVPASR